jgi:hypothetical protein
MSQEGARHRTSLWLAQAQDDLRAARVLQAAGQAAQACFQAQQVGEKAIKALLAADDRDLRSHSLSALLRAHPLSGCPGGRPAPPPCSDRRMRRRRWRPLMPC